MYVSTSKHPYERGWMAIVEVEWHQVNEGYIHKSMPGKGQEQGHKDKMRLFIFLPKPKDKIAASYYNHNRCAPLTNMS
jgi:hypothetical protein